MQYCLGLVGYLEKIFNCEVDLKGDKLGISGIRWREQGMVMMKIYCIYYEIKNRVYEYIFIRLIEFIKINVYNFV